MMRRWQLIRRHHFTLSSGGSISSGSGGGAQTYKQWLSVGQPWRVVEHFEHSARRGDAIDSAATRLYVDALNRLGMSDKALQSVLLGTRGQKALSSDASLQNNILPNTSNIAQSFRPKFNDAPFKSHSNTNTLPPSYHPHSHQNNNILSALGSGTKPIHVIAKTAAPSTKEKVWSAVKFVAAGWLVLSLASMYLDELNQMSGRNPKMFNELDPKHYPTVTFDDVQGVDEAKEELQEIVEFLKDPARFSKLGGKLPKGVLLSGAPGTGKTLLARAIAGEAGVPFFQTSGPEFEELYVGVGAKRVRELFAAARKKAPCIVFIDEIDAVAGKRSARDPHWTRATLNQLLVEMDGFGQHEGIIVIGATNLPGSLDKAVLRPGRFDRNIVVPLPDVKGRAEILKAHAKNVPFAPGVNLNIMARATPGFSGADLANLINHAAIKAATDNKSLVTMDDLEWAKDKIIMGAERKSAVISPRNRKITAFHEAGHALAAIHTDGATPIHKATIMPRGNALGMVSQLPEMDHLNFSRKQLLAELVVCMGGRCSEELVFGSDEVTTGAQSDMARATSVAREMVTQFGMSSTVGHVMYEPEEYANLSPESKMTVEKEMKALLDNAYASAMRILKEHRGQLNLLADALLEYETLSREEIEAVIRGEKIRGDK